MKKLNKTLMLTAGFLLGSLAISPSALAEATSKTATATPATSINDDKKLTISKEQDKANKQAIVDKKKSQKNLLKEVHKGVSEAFKDVVEATKLLSENKDKEAIKKLQQATGKFDTALAADANLAFIPIASSVKVTEYLTTPDLLKAKINIAKELLRDSKIQTARAYLLPLKDDIETRTTSLPMTTYPDAIKLATKLIVEEKQDAAAEILATALSTFMEEVSIIPLSLLRVESMINAASTLDKEKDKEHVIALLEASEDQLKIATLLGYTDKQSALYQGLSDQIKAIKKEARGENLVEKMYTKIKASISSLIDKNAKQEVEHSDANDKKEDKNEDKK